MDLKNSYNYLHILKVHYIYNQQCIKSHLDYILLTTNAQQYMQPGTMWV